MLTLSGGECSPLGGAVLLTSLTHELLSVTTMMRPSLGTVLRNELRIESLCAYSDSVRCDVRGELGPLST